MHWYSFRGARQGDGGILTDPPYEDFNPCQEEPEVVTSESNSPTHPHPPNSAGPPSPSLPPEDDGAPLTVSKAFREAVEMSQHLRKGPENDVGGEWTMYCERHGAENVFEAFKHFLNTHRVDNGRPIWTFMWHVTDLIEEMQQRKASALASVAATDESIGSDEPRQVADPQTVKPPFDVESKEWKLMGTENNWRKLRQFYRYPFHKAFDNFFKQSGIDDIEVARQAFVMKPEFWPTAEDMRAEEARWAEVRAWKPG